MANYVCIVALLVYFCLVVYHFFMLVFVVILSNTMICKQCHCFVFVAFVYNFNVKQCKSKTPVLLFDNFIVGPHNILINIMKCYIQYISIDFKDLIF